MAETEQPNDLHGRLLEAQIDMPNLVKDAENPHFKNKFVSLDSLLNAVVPVLNKHGLILMQSVCVLEGQPALETLIMSSKGGPGFSSTMLLMMKANDPQGQGSAITYARRYSLMAMLGLAAGEDDDGNAGTASENTRQEQDRMQTNPAALVEMGKMLETKGIEDKEDRALLFEALSPGKDFTKLNSSGVTALKKQIMLAAPDTLQAVLNTIKEG